jgi:hypothetical protein
LASVFYLLSSRSFNLFMFVDILLRGSRGTKSGTNQSAAAAEREGSHQREQE